MKDTLESAGGARIANATIPNSGLLNENEVEKKREWRIICSKATKGNALLVPNVYLEVQQLFPFQWKPFVMNFMMVFLLRLLGLETKHF